MTIMALVALFGTAAALGALWHFRILSANLTMILMVLFVTGNTELLLTMLTGELPETLTFLEESDLEYATLLFDLGLLAMAGGMWACQKTGFWTQRMLRPHNHVSLAATCLGTGAVRVYVVLFISAAILKALIAGPLAPLAQLFYPLLMLRFFPIFVLAYRYFTEGRDGPVLLGIAVFEVVANLSFFASFKDLFVVVAAALLLAIRDGARPRPGATVLVVGAMVLTMSTWTFIKADFRNYLTGGEQAQIDTRTMPEKLDFLAGQLGRLGFSEIGVGLYQTMLRVSYNGFFAATTRHVPERLEHSGGAHLLGSVIATVMPRFLFPDKPVIDDSQIVRVYTGLEVAGTDQGTSINIGQFGEFYADLGVFGMLAALAVLGFGLAAFEQMIRVLMGPGLDAAAWTAVFVVVYGIGMYSLPKLIAAFVYTIVATYVLLRFAYPALMGRIPGGSPQMRRVRRPVR